MKSSSLPVFPIERLLSFSTRILSFYGVPEPEARQAAGILGAADLRGIDSHGIARLFMYAAQLKDGRVNPTPHPFIVHETNTTATVDGDNGLGLVVGPFAHQLAMQKAREHGSGWVSVCHSHHFGIAGYYPMDALRHDMIGLAMTNASRIVAPLWSAEAMLGTNPIAIAFPGHEEPPIVIDMATSVVPYGKIEIADRKEEQIPSGWAIDTDGASTNMPRAMMHGGALLPLGSTREMGGHKGYALAAMVDILCCVLSGANWGPYAPAFAPETSEMNESVGKGLGHFFGAWDIAGFMEPILFKKMIDRWIRVFRASRPAAGTDGPLIPGDPERQAHLHRQTHGIPLHPRVYQSLLTLADEAGLPPPEPLDYSE